MSLKNLKNLNKHDDGAAAIWDASTPGGHLCVLHRLEVVRARGLGRWHRWAALSLAVHLATKLFAMRKPGRKSRRRDPNAFGAVCNNSGVERVALLALRCLLALRRASCSATHTVGRMLHR